MLKYFTADYVLPVSSAPIPRGVVVMNDIGEVIALYPHNHAEVIGKPIQQFSGILVPGFINTHCHLELAHLKGQLAEKKGLVEFIKGVVALRAFDETEILAAMQKADTEMYNNGIVAVGDISNKLISKSVKEKSKLFYHTFIELIGLNPDNAETIFAAGKELKEAFGSQSVSITPHAPYSVSKELVRLIEHYSKHRENLFSIHSQESDEENKFYRYKAGKFLELYEFFQQNLDFFRPQARNSLQHFLPIFPENQRILLVHNTYTRAKDLYFVKRFPHEVYWCFCPKANLYIEDRLPKVDLFVHDEFKLTLGTDSYASNNTLCILEELKTIHEHFPQLKLTNTIKWATLNGADYLGLASKLGSLERGKQPGLNLIMYTHDLSLTPSSTVKKLV
ncbi:MAG: amidohydrolase family protein [Sphingobacteriaceae bacterium]